MREREEEGWRRGGGEEFAWGRRGGRRGHARTRAFAGGPGFGGGQHFAGRGPGWWMGDPRMGRGPRARRGDVRAAALALLAEEPMNGYQIIQEIGERSDGVWRPSPGSVYPALQQLEDEGLIVAQSDESGRRSYQLTEEGRNYVEAHPDEVRAPWDAVAGSVGDSAIQMRHLLGQVGMAGYQVLSAGNDAQVRQARQVLTDARKALYRILAADDEDAADSEGSAQNDADRD
jgi:DNA-binding PadR family transcriptional regulator